MSTAQQSKLNALLNAQQKLNAVATQLVAEQVYTAKMQELVQSLQTELDFELMLVEDWS